MDKKGALSTPLVFWSQSGLDIQHVITALSVFSSYIVTGSASGELVMWKAQDQTCVPLLIATPGIALECHQLVFIHPPYKAALRGTIWVASLHADNRIRVWEWADGRCIAISSPGLLEPIARARHMSEIQRRLLAIGGEAVVHIIDAWNLTSLCRYHLPESLVDLCAQTYATSTRMLVLCGEDQVLVWDLGDVTEFLANPTAKHLFDPRPTLKLTMGSAEKPSKIALTTDASLLAVAYEYLISFVHESWVMSI